ncbi:MAG: hypothetical protein WB565_02055 [Acidimicrobiales bacterium]
MAETDDQNGSPTPDDTKEDRRAAVLAARGERARTRRSMDKIDERERRFSFAAAGLAAVFGIAVYVAETSNPHFRLAKNQLTPQTTLVLGLGAAALLLITTFIGRRALIGFVALFTFLAFGTQYFLGVPFLALAIWLLYRSFKIQRETSAAARATPTESPSGRATTAGSSGKPTPASRGWRSKSKGIPEGNKRYTPKRPPPPAPKPSRRERKASQSKE